MDLSGIIFVALAIAWGAYLIPKALKQHEEAKQKRAVEGFSDSVRVLARREPVNATDARLVVTSKERPLRLSESELKRRRKAARASARRALRRRRRVLTLLVLANLIVIGLATAVLVPWWAVAIPGGILLAWLITCRVMVKSEHEKWDQLLRQSRAQAEAEALAAELAAYPEPAVEVEVNDQGFVELAPESDTQVGPAVIEGDPELWDPVPVPLPTYVAKSSAKPRTVPTIALDDSGVWTSGHHEADSNLVRRARAADEEVDRTEARAVGG